MKFYSKSKHLIVTALTFFAIFSFLSPTIVRAQSEDDVFYPGLGRLNEQLSMRYWVKSIVFGGSTDILLALACGGENDKEKVWGNANGSEGCVPTLDQVTASLQGDKPRMIGGLASMSGMAIEQGITEPVIPTDMALFMDDTFKDTIFSTQSYAQERNWSEPSAFFRSATYTLWKTARNIALGLLGVLLGVAGLSILFRSKLSPQVTVTVANVLPYLPLSIIGIVLSYPIMAVIFNLLIPLLSMAWTIGIQVVAELSSSTVTTTGGVYSVVRQAFMALLNPITWLGISNWMTISVVFGFIMLTAVILVLIALVRFVIEYAKTIVLFVFYVIAFPLISAIAILPGKQNLFSILFKKVAANLLALPIMTLFVLIGMGFLASLAPSAQSEALQSLSGFEFVGFGGVVLSTIVRFAIGWGIVWQSFKTRKILEDFFGAGGSLGDSLKGGAPSGGPGGKR